MKHGMGAEDDQAPELAIPLETLCFIIMKARQFDAKEAATEPDPGSNPTDDENAAILQDQADDPVQVRIDIAHLGPFRRRTDRPRNLMWLGRDDYGLGDWPSVRAQAVDAHNKHTAEYLTGDPLLADHLAASLDLVALSCADFESGHL